MRIRLLGRNGQWRGKVFDFSALPVLIGTAPGNTLQFDSAQVPTVAAFHCEICELDGQVWLREKRNRFGTFLDGKDCGQTPVRLQDGSTLRLGAEGPEFAVALSHASFVSSLQQISLPIPDLDAITPAPAAAGETPAPQPPPELPRIYCTESLERIPVEYFAQGKAMYCNGKPYLAREVTRLGLKADPNLPPHLAFLGTRSTMVSAPAAATAAPQEEVRKSASVAMVPTMVSASPLVAAKRPADNPAETMRKQATPGGDAWQESGTVFGLSPMPAAAVMPSVPAPASQKAAADEKAAADAAAEAKQRAHEEAARLAEEEKQRAEEEALRAEEERLRQEEADAARVAEEDRQRAEAEELREVEERQRQEEAEAAGMADDARLRAGEEARSLEEKRCAEEKQRKLAAAMAPSTEEALLGAQASGQAEPRTPAGGMRTAADGGLVLSGHGAGVTDVAFSPDGRLVVSASTDRTLKVWDTATGRELQTLGGFAWGVTCLALSPDGRLVVAGSWDKTIRVWNLETLQELRALAGHTGGVASVAFAPSGEHLLSGGGDGTLRLWDVATGAEMSVFAGHTGRITSVAFSRDGRLALSGSEDHTVRLWDIERGAEARVFNGHTGAVKSVAFSPDGSMAVSASDDGTVRLWNLATGRETRSMPA